MSRRRLSARRWRVVRREALERAGWRCEWVEDGQRCDRPGRLEVDHVVPLKAGGAPFDLENLQALCRPHHWRKTGEENSSIPRRHDQRAKADALVTELL